MCSHSRQPADCALSIEPGHDEQIAALLERPRGRDQRAAPGAGLDDDGRIGEAADEPVPARERAAARVRVGHELRDDRAAVGDDAVRQARVSARVEAGVARAEDRDGRAAFTGRGGVARAVDPDGEP